MSGPSRSASRSRGARTAATLAVLVVLALVTVLVGLVGPGDGGSEAVPGASGARATAPASASEAPSSRDAQTGLRTVALRDLPREAQQTVALIDAGGPFPYEQDGATFGNRERVLPSHPRGWYREYTVLTPGEGDRGARRIVTGDDDRLIFYTADHYTSFVQVRR